MEEIKYIHSNVNLFHIDKSSKYIVNIKNSGNLELDFFEYANNFFEAAQNLNKYLLEEASKNKDIVKLDSLYYAMIYLYRQGLELLLKACIFQSLTDMTSRKDTIGVIRHDLKMAFEKLVELRGLDINCNENSKWVMDFFSDISKIDRNSDMFRYPFSTKMNSWFEKQTHVSLVATKENMNKAYTIISSLYNKGVIIDECINAKSPKLIIEGGDYYSQSVICKYNRNSYYQYYNSYMEAADLLKKQIIETQRINLFLPMCYLYRNAIELALKQIIVEDIFTDYSEASNSISKKKHSVLALWNVVEPEVRKHVVNETELDDALKYIKTFHDYDLRSDLFRYPCDKDMNSYFTSLQKFDIDNVSSCFEELCNFLDGIDSMFKSINQNEIGDISYYSGF
ncbi:MAG: hypothetical protein HFJ45_10335 [Clostridia bacterium]|nr:hypothetical protein [Clostridia bacterium]